MKIKVSKVWEKARTMHLINYNYNSDSDSFR